MDSPFLAAPDDALSTVLVPERAHEQLPLMPMAPIELTAAISSLALGGAERIVLDWAQGCASRYRIRLIVLHDVQNEWPMPAGIQVTRLCGKALLRELEILGAAIAAGGNRVVLCHLLSASERDALTRGGAHVVPCCITRWRDGARRLMRFRIRAKSSPYHDTPPGSCALRSGAANAPSFTTFRKRRRRAPVHEASGARDGLCRSMQR